MYQTLIVVDDFLDFVNELRHKALKADYVTYSEQTYFPGNNSKQPYYVKGLDRLVSNLVGENLTPSPSTSHAKFRLALEGDEGKGGVHIDKCQWSGILYLTKDSDSQGGTDFYRHKLLNSDRAPLNMNELNQMGVASFESFWHDYLLKDGTDFSKWELTTHIPMKYNRLVLFRPWLFHNAGNSFGNNIENGRLIYPLFYDSTG
ncbi:DUF6445 family protein [Idiomarina loihiensis]|uniref:DUF6445 family protein n=1 Tax=Idiomarina loihiensis TaxID=135577 RepID=UPI00384B2839